MTDFTLLKVALSGIFFWAFLLGVFSQEVDVEEMDINKYVWLGILCFIIFYLAYKKFCIYICHYYEK